MVILRGLRLVFFYGIINLICPGKDAPLEVVQVFETMVHFQKISHLTTSATTSAVNHDVFLCTYFIQIYSNRSHGDMVSTNVREFSFIVFTNIYQLKIMAIIYFYFKFLNSYFFHFSFLLSISYKFEPRIIIKSSKSTNLFQ
jgi:hypothetical protein